MALLKPLYDKQDDIPEAHRELFTEKNGKWELTGIEGGLKTTADVDRLQKSLTAAQADNKKLKGELGGWTALGKLDELQAKLDRVAELETLVEANKGKDGVDAAKLEELVAKRLEAKLKGATGPLERQLRQLTEEKTALATERDTLVGERKQRTIRDEIRTAALAKEVGLRSEALEDALLLGERVFEITEDGKVLTRDNVGVTPGVNATAWLQDLREKRPHWWPESVGGGSRGARGGGAPGGPDNPWSSEGWNMTKQGQFLREHGAEKAKKAAEAAGTTVGGSRPKPKAAAGAK
jgi:hypothetical protein